MKFYTYRQNNSGGSFYGYINVIIEANDNYEADRIAEENEIYFDGVDNDQDCPCCGDRWSRQWSDDEGKEKPMIYEKVHNPDGVEYSDWNKQSIIIYKNGNKEIFKV